MESHRAQTVQRGQQELARRAARELRSGSELHLDHYNQNRIDGVCETQLQNIRERSNCDRRGNGFAEYPPAQDSSRMELHHQTVCPKPAIKNVKLFLRGPLVYLCARASRAIVAPRPTAIQVGAPESRQVYTAHLSWPNLSQLAALIEQRSMSNCQPSRAPGTCLFPVPGNAQHEPVGAPRSWVRRRSINDKR